MKLWFRRKFCAHEFYFEDIRYVINGAIGTCHKCGKVLEAPYGLALPGTLMGYRPKPSKEQVAER